MPLIWCQSNKLLIYHHPLILYEDIYGTRYLKSHHNQFLTDQPVYFCTIFQYNRLWNQINQLYCVMEPWVSNGWRPFNKYHRIQIRPLIDHIFCMTCANKKNEIAYISHVSQINWRKIAKLYHNILPHNLIKQTLYQYNMDYWIKANSEFWIIISICKYMA